MRAACLVLEVNRATKAGDGHILFDQRIEPRETVREFRPIDDLVRNRSDELVRGREIGRPKFGLVNLGLGRRKLELKADAERLRQFLLIEDRLQLSNVQ